MTLKKDDTEKELECYTKIIHLFSTISKDPITLETYKDKAIIKTMNSLRDPKNQTWLRNALIILLSLSPGEMQLSFVTGSVKKKTKAIVYLQKPNGNMLLEAA